MSEETLLEFPCDFCVKAMGHAAEDFDAVVAAIVRTGPEDAFVQGRGRQSGADYLLTRGHLVGIPPRIRGDFPGGT